MIYFCPARREWFEYFTDSDLYLSGYRPPWDINASMTDQTIIDKWNTISAPPAPELKSVAVLTKVKLINFLPL